jgi:hypothetical protein
MIIGWKAACISLFGFSKKNCGHQSGPRPTNRPAIVACPTPNGKAAAPSWSDGAGTILRAMIAAAADAADSRIYYFSL